MAINEKVQAAALDTSDTTIYTAPGTGTARVLLLQVANVDTASSAANVFLDWTDDSASTTYSLANNIEVAFGDSLSLIGGGMILEANDAIKARASASGDLELTLAIQEIT